MLKPAHIEALKHLALRGGSGNFVVLSSREFGRILGISQQSASKRILELIREGAIIRELGVRKQKLRLARPGMDALRKEHIHYQKIFVSENKIEIMGTVVTGMGEGQYYLNHREYNRQFQQKLCFKPYEGTLNLRVCGSELSKFQSLREMNGIQICGFRKGGRTFGDVRSFLCKIGNLDCAVIIPTRSHYQDVIEIVSRYHLRRTLGLKDGDEVKLQIFI